MGAIHCPYSSQVDPYFSEINVNRISEYQKNALQCLKLAEASNEGDRRGLIQMAEDWHALADKVRQREANPQEQEPEPVAAWPKSAEPSEPPLRPKRPQRKARTPVQTVILRSR